MGETGRYKRRHHHNQTLAYDLKRRTLQFYDKLAEMKRKRDPIPEGLKGKHVMRYELQWKTVVNKQWKRQLQVGSLSDPDFFQEMIFRWQAEYDNIPKIHLQRLSPRFEWKLFVKQAINHFVEINGGKDKVLAMADNARLAGSINYTQRNRFRKRIQANLADVRVVEPSRAIEELDAKIKLACEKLLDA